MYKVAAVTVLVILLYIGCINAIDPISIGSNKPAFVVDSISIDANVRSDTMSVAHMTFFALKVSYHFEGKPGALTNMKVSAGQIGFGAYYSPAGFIPINLHYTQSQEFMDPNVFTGQDSIFLRVQFKGMFGERNKNIDTTYGSFVNNDSMWVRLR